MADVKSIDNIGEGVEAGIGSLLHYGSQMPDGDLFSVIDLALNERTAL